MTATELKDWLGTAQSRSVGDSGGQGESTGHRMGRTITELLGTKAADLDDADLQKMRKVTATYVHRHLAQRPEGDVSDTPWRYSLMNWGHDPLN
jgi:Protein of unknown function (DUF3140)